MKTILSRKDAITQGLTRYFTGIPCIHGHVCEKYTKSSTCIECSNTSRRKHYQNNKEQYKQHQLDNRDMYRKSASKHYYANQAYYQQKHKDYNNLHKKQSSDNSKQRYIENRKDINDRNKQHYHNNKSIYRAISAKRRAYQKMLYLLGDFWKKNQ